MSDVTHIKQPAHSKCCGQACVAMVLGKTLADIIGVIGDKGTHYTTLRRAAAHYGREFSAVTSARSQALPSSGVHIARIIWSRKPHKSHFVVLAGQYVHDPACDTDYRRDLWLYSHQLFRDLPELTFTSWVTLLEGSQ